MKKSIFLFFAAILCAIGMNAETYRYSGEKDGWAGTEMTASTDGFYSYYGPVTGGHQFKIGTSSNQWAYNYSYVSSGFNNTDIKDIGDWGKDNCYTWTNATHYILVYYPNTTKNTTSKVKICASTVLPNDAVSEPEPEPEPEPTELTYNVTVPAGTKACYIAGDMNTWSFTEMTKVDDTHYTITIEGAKKSDGYKYASGGDWGYVEKDASGNEIGNRTYVDGNDVVARWASVYDPDAVEQELTYSVTVPEGTYACYIAMDTDPAQEGWEFNEMTKVDDTHYTFTRTGLKNKTYKYASGAGWEYVEKTAEDGEVADRQWAENDVVAKWTSVYNPTAPTYDYYIAGTLAGGWSAKQQGLEKDGELYKATFTELNAGTYQFKITDGQWNTEEDKTHEYTTLGAQYEEVSSVDGNIQIMTEEAKNITVIFDATAGEITFEGLTEKAPEPTFDYYIVGSFNGNDPKKAENGMTLDDAVYKATVTLAAGDNTLKVTDGTWDKTWGANELGAAYEEVSNPNDGYNNIKITLAAGKEITVIFDATAGKITFEGLTPYVAPLTYTVTVPAGTEKCYIAGNMNSWAFQEMEAVTGETNKFTITIVGAKETDEYKYACQADWAYAEVIDGGGNRTNWSELDEVTAWGKPVVVTYQLKGVGGWEQPGIELVQNPVNDKEYMLTCQALSATDAIKVVRLEDGVIKDYYGNGTVKDGVTVAVSYDGDANITLPAGTYNFYFDTNESEKKLWIAAATDCVTEPTPEVIRTVEAGYYYTICMPKAMTNVQGASFWQFVGRDANFAYVEPVATPTVAGKPYLMYAIETGDVTAVLEGPEATVGTNGALYGTFEPMDQDKLTAAGDNIYLLVANELRRVDGQTGNRLPANRAYVDLDDLDNITGSSLAPNVRRVALRTNIVTSVDNVDTSAQPVKTIINGQLFILRGEKMYDAQGKLVK